jgi:Uma2 family endonuclease
VVNPVLLVEVLSPSTIDFDLGQKFEHFSQIPSLRAAIYVWQDRQQIELRERQADGSWQTSQHSAGAHLVLAQPGCTIPVDEIYAGLMES